MSLVRWGFAVLGIWISLNAPRAFAETYPENASQVEPGTVPTRVPPIDLEEEEEEEETYFA